MIGTGDEQGFLNTVKSRMKPYKVFMYVFHAVLVLFVVYFVAEYIHFD